MALRFHWMLPKGGEAAMDNAMATARVLTTKDNSPARLPDPAGWCDFAKHAERAGIESVLISFSRYEPDTLVCACALGQMTKRLKFIAAYRLGLMQPAIFIQQINSLSQLIGPRIAINVVAGSSPEELRGYGDFLSHDERYQRADEFLSICHRLWEKPEHLNYQGRYYRIEGSRPHTPFVAHNQGPEIYIAGHSAQARSLSFSQGSTWLRLIDTPEKLAPVVADARAHGTEICLRLCVVCRPTRQQALVAAKALIPTDQTIGREERQILKSSESKTLHTALNQADEIGWLNSFLWAGLVPYYGSSALTLVGTPQELADIFLQYEQIGVTQFIISGWPKQQEMVIFGEQVIPLIRQQEALKQGSNRQYSRG